MHEHCDDLYQKVNSGLCRHLQLSHCADHPGSRVRLLACVGKSAISPNIRLYVVSIDQMSPGWDVAERRPYALLKGALGMTRVTAAAGLFAVVIAACGSNTAGNQVQRTTDGGTAARPTSLGHSPEVTPSAQDPAGANVPIPGEAAGATAACLPKGLPARCPSALRIRSDAQASPPRYSCATITDTAAESSIRDNA